MPASFWASFTWPASRDGDKEWQQQIIAQLTEDGASQEHIHAVESEVGAVRYRPAEVAGAGAAKSLPVAFAEAAELAEQILERLRAENFTPEAQCSIRENDRREVFQKMNVFRVSPSNGYMKISLLLKSSLMVVTGGLLATGCVVRERPVYQPAPPPVAYVPPPAPAPAPPSVVLAPGEVVVETPPPAPYVEPYPVVVRPGFLWVPGAWSWHGRWVWERGHWAHPPHRGQVWVGGRYETRGNVRVYIGGGWR